MTLQEVLGQPRAIHALTAALRGASLHHAYLFLGPEGVGKELAARRFAQALLCSDRPNEGCGRCSACVRVDRQNHPDAAWMMSDEERIARGLAGRSDFSHVPARDIRVEQVRELQERLAVRALEGERKVVVVAGADRLTPQAQNAFLKTLEEPPAGTVLILVAQAVDRLLPTLRSRCAKVHFGPLPLELVTERVRQQRKLDEGTARLVAVMSGGSISRALALNVDALAQRKALFEAYEDVRKESPSTVLRFAEGYGASREDALEAIEMLTVWLRDLLVKQTGAGEIANQDLAELVEKAASRHATLALHRRHQLLEETREAIAVKNGSPRMQLERFLIQGGAA